MSAWHLLSLFACANAPDGDSALSPPPATTSPAQPTTPPTTPARAVSVHTGPLGSCALTETGEVRCWGERPLVDGAPTGTFSELSLWAVACGLRADGTLSCWGDDTLDGGILDGVPEGTYTTISVGEQFACALDPMGAPTCWGMLEWLEGAFAVQSPPDPPLATVVAGSFFACGVGLDDLLACWGADEETPPHQPDLDLIEGAPEGELTAVVDAFRYVGCVISPDGVLDCWGSAEGSTVDTGIAFREPSGTFVSVDLDYANACALDIEGTIHCWGRDAAPAPDGVYVDVSAGYDHACAVDTEGRVSCWGSDDAGETVVPAGLAG